MMKTGNHSWHETLNVLKKTVAKVLPRSINSGEVYNNVKVANIKSYSSDIMLPNFLAPAYTHKRVSLLILSRITKERGGSCY
jgi:hypothetical protein